MTETLGSADRRSPDGHARLAPGTPCWVSLMVHDLAGAQAFYGALFGWEFHTGPTQLGPYSGALLGGREVAGIGQMPPDRHLPLAWTPYLATEDVDLTAETVRHRGGTVGVGPLDVGDLGRLALVSDPAGAVFGIWQVAEHGGIAVRDVPGALAWNELRTHEARPVAEFYEAVFGYNPRPSTEPGVDHITLRLGRRPVVSVHGVGLPMPYDRGAHWMPYFEIADVDRGVEVVRDRGGAVIQPPREEKLGRTAVVADPEGAELTLIRPAA